MSQRSQPAQDKSGYLSEDTIAAIGTAVGGAIAMVRVSGKNAFTALAQIVQSPHTHVQNGEARKLYRARLIDPTSDQELDDALFVRFLHPDSYTGEDLVEFHLHGGAFVASRVMETLYNLGVRQALPGEFSFRAVRNGKMSLSQAQAVADLISASNDGAVGLALEKMSGTQNRLLHELAENLRQLAVLGEAGIDFSDQNIEEVSLPRLRLGLDEIVPSLEKLAASYDRGFRLQEGVRVAIVGLPNAGKSSFFNTLLGEDRSIVSEFAGTTRDIVHEKVTLRGVKSTLTLRFEDTAGLRIADHPVEKTGVERSQRSAREADLILFLVDPFSTPESVEEQWAVLDCPSKKTLGIFTKCDLTDAVRLGRLRNHYNHLGIPFWQETSSVTGQGITPTINAIVEYCEQWTHRTHGEVLLTRLDHLAAVQTALDDLKRAQQAPELDLFAADLRQALHSLGSLIGETLPDDILGKIFSDFCIGK
ncbi:tRNA uridine-5-carboxymethylaminomethyl(34) synthesis GTPase MnmE [Bdellovibrionota bacterium FG-1]